MRPALQGRAGSASEKRFLLSALNTRRRRVVLHGTFSPQVYKHRADDKVDFHTAEGSSQGPSQGRPEPRQVPKKPHAYTRKSTKP